jgi:hypothetical protein
MAAGASATSAKANEIAERLIGLMRSAESSPKASALGEELPLDEMLQNFLRQQLEPVADFQSLMFETYHR